MITFEGVSKRFPDGTLAIHDLDLTIETGELTVLVGPSGCGKTTSLRMINRLDEASAGVVSIDGRDIRSSSRTELRRGIGYVMQHSGLFPHRTIRANIATVPQLLGWDKKRAQARVDELIDLVGLAPELADRYPHQLSGGQQQRVGVARALAVDPPIMLMDEPFAAVDPIVRKHLQDEFLALQQRLQKTIVFVTHDIDEAIKLGDRIAIFETGGRLAQYARPSELLAAPADDFVVDFLGAERELKRLALIQVADARAERGPVVMPGDNGVDAREIAREAGRDWIIVLDDQERLIGWLPVADLSTDPAADTGALNGQTPRVFERSVQDTDTLRAALGAIVCSPLGAVPCVNADGMYTGLLTQASLNEQLA